MPASYPYRLRNLEMPPPEGSWEQLSRELDQQFPAGEGKVAEKVFMAELAPPPMAWSRIQEELESPAIVPVEKTPVIRMRPYRLAAAAVVTGLLFLAAWWYFSPKPATEAIASEKPAAPPATAPSSPKKILNPVKSAALTARATRTRPAAIEPQQPLPVPVRESVHATEELPEEAYAALDETKAQLVHLTEDAQVSAPLIRDKKGKVIMDMSLLSGNAGSYITVTGPNGEPTRISSKFANYLIYLNKEESKEEYLDFLIRNSSVWKKRFDEWRNRIMNRQSFMPSTANFFDILELQELIRENQ